MCSQAFKTIPSELLRGSGIYCSKACYGQTLLNEMQTAFWGRLVQTEKGCRVWTGLRTPFGYGIVTMNRRRHLAHRLAWETTYGAIPDGILVCHRCDNPPCCEPTHLFLGSAADNVADMIGKGRHIHGELVITAKLTADIVRVIRASLANGERQADLAAKYGVTQRNIALISARRTWRHLP